MFQTLTKTMPYSPAHLSFFYFSICFLEMFKINLLSLQLNRNTSKFPTYKQHAVFGQRNEGFFLGVWVWLNMGLRGLGHGVGGGGCFLGGDRLCGFHFDLIGILSCKVYAGILCFDFGRFIKFPIPIINQISQLNAIYNSPIYRVYCK